MRTIWILLTEKKDMYRKVLHALGKIGQIISFEKIHKLLLECLFV